MNQISQSKNSLFVLTFQFAALAFALTASLLVARFPLSSSILATYFIFAYSAPVFFILSYFWKSRTKFFLNSFLSLSATSVIASLLFAFTPLSSYKYLIWFGSILALVAALLIIRSSSRSEHDCSLSTHFNLEFGSIFVALISGAILFRTTFFFDELDPTWLPDDFPFFALLADSTSSGEPSTGFFSGMTINYHWLTYAFFGGLNRFLGVGQISGLLVIGTIFSWMLLTLGAVSVVRALTMKKLPVLLAVFAVVFSNSVGLYVYSTSGLGGSIVSPSTLLTSSWFLATLLTINHFLTYRSIPPTIFFVMLIMGFALALGKISSAIITLIGIGILLLHNFSVQRHVGGLDFRKLGSNTLFALVPFAMGIGLVSQLYLKSAATEMGVEASLFNSSSAGVYQWVVLLLPVLTTVFSYAVMVFPTLISKNIWKSSGLFATSATLAFTGILIIFFFDFGSSNETWFLTASFALILPTSSVAVAYSLGKEVGKTKTKRLFQFILLALVSTATAAFLVAFSSFEFLVVRPYLTPTILVSLGVTFAFLWTQIANRGLGANFGPITRLTAAYLFILSLSFGLIIRVDAAFFQDDSQISISLARDTWIKTTYSKSIESRVLFRNQPVAIYSDSLGEATLTRWIPYFLNTDAYVISRDDKLPDYYTPTNEIVRRQNLVENYVTTGDLQACRGLQQDGIQTIWLTQGIDFKSAKQSELPTPKLLPVTCW